MPTSTLDIWQSPPKTAVSRQKRWENAIFFKKSSQKVWSIKYFAYLCTRKQDSTGCSAVRLAHLLWEQGVPGSNPGIPTIVERSLKNDLIFLLLVTSAEGHLYGASVCMGQYNCASTLSSPHTNTDSVGPLPLVHSLLVDIQHYSLKAG